MATLVLGAVGTAIGSSFGGSILGLSAATIGGMIGSTIGGMIDATLFAPSGTQRIEGPRLDDVRLTSSTEGAVVTRVFGRMRVGGNIIWATDFREEVIVEKQGGGKGSPTIETTEYRYYASFAVALCEGPITGVSRVWADGKPLDASDINWRLYPGSETQDPDPHIEALEGAGNVPGYRGTAYAVFEDLDVTDFGNRIPQLSFEVFRPSPDPTSAEQLVRAVTLIPASGEFTYATEVIDAEGDAIEAAHGVTLASGVSGPQNQGSTLGVPDIVASLDQLQAAAPNLDTVTLVVAWFGTDLRMGQCQIKPGVELSDKVSWPEEWRVNGVSRATAHVVSTDAEGRPAYGGTPSDFAVVQAIQEIRSRGLRVNFYPFILMDIPPGNVLPNPYSDNAASVGQPVFPWRGRITCSPAAGFEGSADKTATAAGQVVSFFGSATVADFSVTGETVSWTGGADFGLRRMVLHYAHLCAAAGGVDAFLIGTEMRGTTTVRGEDNAFPAVTAFRLLAAAVRTVLGQDTKISYAADWSEYFGHHPQDGSGDVFFHLDPLWADGAIDFIGIDNYMPLSDWRDGDQHADAVAGAGSIYDLDYLQGNIEGGEGFDWFYASPADRAAQVRTPISDGLGKPWVFRYKDLRAWWLNEHFDRPGGVEAATPTAWVPQSKPFWFTEAGAPAVDRGTNQPNVFFDPKSSESFLPYHSRGWRDETIQRRYIEALQRYWNAPANNPVSSVYGARMVRVDEIAYWTWDARPFPAFPGRTDLWTDGENWTLGHWLTGRLGGSGLAELVRELCVAAGMAPEQIDVSRLAGHVPGFAMTAIESPRSALGMLARFYGFDASESEGVIRFVPRHGRSVAVLGPDDLVAPGNGASEAFELTRGQETELPLALKWRLLNADEEFSGLTVEARRITVDTARIEAEQLPLATSQGQADRAVRRALGETWIAREEAAFALPPSRLALDATDVVRLEVDGRQLPLVVRQVADGEARRIDARRDDRALHDLAVGSERRIAVAGLPTPARPRAVLANLPQLDEDAPALLPYAAALAQPWEAMAVWRQGSAGFELAGSLLRPAGIGELVTPLPAGVVWRWDRAAELVVRIDGRQLASQPDAAVLAGRNALAVQTGADAWEIVQFAQAELIGPQTYRLTRLLRGQRGTERFIGAPAPAGSVCILLDTAVRAVAVAPEELGTVLPWRIGAASQTLEDLRFTVLDFAPTGRGLRSFAPVHARRLDHADGSITLTWTRRSRALAADAWAAAEVDLPEPSERYDLEIRDGSTVVRSVAGLPGPIFSYGAGQVVADFGSVPAALGVRVWQVGSLGRGDPLEAVLALDRRSA